MSELRTNRIIPRDGLVSGASGGIIQIAITQKSDVFTWSSNGDTEVPGMSVSITPTRSDSKVLIQVQIGASGMFNDAFPMFFQLYKNGSQISGAKGSGTAGASDPVKCATYSKNYVYYTGTSTSFSFLDSPATTSATTYTLYAQRHASGGTGYFNATGKQINERYAETISTITAMEVSG